MRRIFPIIAGVAALFIAWAAHAQDVPQPPPAERLVTRLADADWATRQRAMLALMDHPEVDDSLLSAGFRASRSPEQRHRLTLIALHHFYHRQGREPQPAQPGDGNAAEDSAGIGVDLTGGMSRIVQPHEQPKLQEVGGPGVVINAAMPGFPAFTRLVPGDLVVALNGETFAQDLDVNGFIESIKKNPPGTEIVLRVLRDDALIDVPLVTDSKQRLERVYGQEPKDVEWAMSQPQFRQYLASLQGVPNDSTLELLLPSGETPAVKPGQAQGS